MATRVTRATPESIQQYLRDKGTRRQSLTPLDQQVIGVFYSRFVDITEEIIINLEARLNQVVDGFFADLTTYMGQEEDLATLLPESGAPAWKPLNLKYVKEKGNSLFWVYSGGGSRVLSSGRGRGGGLLVQMRGKRGLKAFGPVAINSKGSAVATRSELQNLRGQLGLTASDLARSRRQSKIFVIDLWTGIIKNRGERIRNIETTLLRRGVFTNIQRTKLLNKGQRNYRPLILPFMNYYARVRFPAEVKSFIASIRGRGGDSGRPRRVNPPSVSSISRRFQR